MFNPRLILQQGKVIIVWKYNLKILSAKIIKGKEIDVRNGIFFVILPTYVRKK